MPICVSKPITVFEQEAFHAVDKVVTGCAFGLHNELGRNLDERLYQVELAARLNEQKMSVAREVQITISFDGFSRDYFADLLVNGGVIIETKAAENLTAAHRAQVLNYLYLCGLHHATLLNFRAERVQHEFVSTHYTLALRRKVTWQLAAWKPLSAGCNIFHDVLRGVLADWGSGLDPVLYRDAVTHFLGGEAQVIRDVEIFTKHGALGTQPTYLLAGDIAFAVTASVHRPRLVEEHYRRFLQHTRLRAIQWVNLHRQTVCLQTIQR